MKLTLLNSIIGLLTIPAYILGTSIYNQQLVYQYAHISKATLVWLIAIVGWGYIVDRFAPRFNVSKKKGWVIYFIGVAALVWYVMG